MVFLAVAIELGAGLALHKAWRTGAADAEDWKALRNDLRERRERMIALAAELTRLQNEPAVFVARFWRNFYRAMLTHTVRNAITKLSLLILLLIPFLQVSASAEEKLTLVVALDLTRSVAGTGPNGRTDFEENVDGITRLLRQVPGSCHVVVLGITGKSFVQPDILLSARVEDDPGYFGERLGAARRELVRSWLRISSRLAPQFRYTDIVGTLLLAAQVFDRAPLASRKVLVVFSDMRNHTSELDLESGSTTRALEALKKQSLHVPQARLSAVEIYALGVDGNGKSTGYWLALKALWTEYFYRAGGDLRSYSVLRELPVLREDSKVQWKPQSRAPFRFSCYRFCQSQPYSRTVGIYEFLPRKAAWADKEVATL
jgi:hypothetical protein